MNEVSGVRGIGRPICVSHLFAVAVVGGDQASAAKRQNFRDDSRDAGIDCLHRFYAGRDYAGVADHIGIREV